MKGKLRFDWNPEGIACEIVVPVDQLAGSTEVYDHKDRGS
jgi:hypothetical protein